MFFRIVVISIKPKIFSKTDPEKLRFGGGGNIFDKEGDEMWDERDVPGVLIKKVLIVEVQVVPE